MYSSSEPVRCLLKPDQRRSQCDHVQHLLLMSAVWNCTALISHRCTAVLYHRKTMSVAAGDRLVLYCKCNCAITRLKSVAHHRPALMPRVAGRTLREQVLYMRILLASVLGLEKPGVVLLDLFCIANFALGRQADEKEWMVPLPPSTTLRYCCPNNKSRL